MNVLTLRRIAEGWITGKWNFVFENKAAPQTLKMFGWKNLYVAKMCCKQKEEIVTEFGKWAIEEKVLSLRMADRQENVQFFVDPDCWKAINEPNHLVKKFIKNGDVFDFLKDTFEEMEKNRIEENGMEFYTEKYMSL